MKLLDKKELANGMVLSVYDFSKKVATDRWLVKIGCEAVIPLPFEFFADLEGDDDTLLAAIRRNMGDSLAFSVAKERNFVDGREKDAVLNALLGQVFDNMLAYLDNPAFPRALFKSRYEEARRNWLMEQQHQDAVQEEEDDGPADFSACFKE